MKFKNNFKAGVVFTLLFVAIGIAVMAQSNNTIFNFGVGIKRKPTLSPDAFIRNETDNKLTFGKTGTSIGDLELIGVNHVTNINIGTSLVDGFVPASADSDNGLGLPIDAIIDSLRFYSSDEAAGDSAIFTLYRNTTIAVIISGPDTLAVNGVVDYTGVADASRDLNRSADENFSVFVDVKGTYTDALVQIFWRSYDVQ